MHKTRKMRMLDFIQTEVVATQQGISLITTSEYEWVQSEIVRAPDRQNSFITEPTTSEKFVWEQAARFNLGVVTIYRLQTATSQLINKSTSELSAID